MTWLFSIFRQKRSQESRKNPIFQGIFLLFRKGKYSTKIKAGKSLDEKKLTGPLSSIMLIEASFIPVSRAFNLSNKACL